jgi:hypothetical protein
MCERAAMVYRWGPTVTLPPDLRDEHGTGVVVVYAVRDAAAAGAYVTAEDELYGNPARAELRESVGWCVVVDLRPQIARAAAEMGSAP